MTGLDLLLDALPPWVLVGGKGGVGKTTCAAALAARSASRATPTLLISTDPAGTLGEAIGVPLTGEPREIPGRTALSAMQLDAAAARDAFLRKWRGTLVTILDRGTYLDEDDVDGLIDSALPGADEIFALLALGELGERTEWERIIIDTAPTGHTLRLLALPRTFAALIELLDTMQAKHRFMVSALTHRYREDVADAFIAEMRERIRSLRARLADANRSAAVVVTRVEDMVFAETRRYLDELAALGIRIGAIVINAFPGGSQLSAGGPGPLPWLVPELARPPVGFDGIERWGWAMTRIGNVHRDYGNEVKPLAPRRRVEPGRRVEIPVRALTIVGGKGGVGKTTVACAIAIDTAAHQRVLLVSTDPAPSIADALAQPVGDDEAPVAGAGGLVARQMDAEAAFERLRADYRDRVDALFDGLIAKGVNAAHDRAVIRDLLALAPPGIDELYALASLGETLAESRFDVIVVDPAPTGHLLRLLEMPALALDWSHRLMRIMLKYREVVGLGDTAAELLAFSKRTRAVRELLGDPARSGAYIVTLDEPLVRGETVRLLAAVGERGVGILGVLWNRVDDEPGPLSLPRDVPQLLCSALEPPPIGVDALRQWRNGWTLVSGANG